MKDRYNQNRAADPTAFTEKYPLLLILIVLFQLFLSPLQAQTFQSASSSYAISGDPTLTITKPATMSVGDVMIAAIDVRPMAAGINVPAGWTLIKRTASLANPGGGENEHAFYWKAATASEPANYTWTFTNYTSGGSAGGILCFSGVNMYDPIDLLAGKGNASSLTQSTPSITTTAANTVVIASVALGSSSTWRAVTGWTEVVDDASRTNDVYGVAICVNYKTVTSPSAVSFSTSTTSTASSTADVGVGQILSLTPAPVATTISYPLTNYCKSTGSVSVTRVGATGGTYSAPAGLTIDPTTGTITTTTSTPGTYTVTYTYASGYTATDQVTIDPLPVAGTIAGSTNVCTGTNSGTLTLSGQTGSVVRWESSPDGTTWTTIANTTTSLTYTNLTATTQYRVVVQSGTCGTATSTAATVTVNPLSVGGTISSSTTVCSGANSGTLTLSGQTGNVVRWESSPNGTTWTTIANTTTSLTYTNITATTQYRAVVQSGACSIANATAATITVNPPSVGGTVAGAATVCSGSSGTLTLSGQTGNVIRWESSPNGTTWTIIANTTTSLTYTNITATTQYRAVVQSGSCSAANATAATVTIKTPPTAAIAGTATVCQNTLSPNVTFTGANGTAPYTFTYNINGGANQTVSTTLLTSSVTVAQATSATGTFTYNLVSVTSAAGCSQAQTGSAAITVTSGGVWTGAFSSLWQIPGNWQCNQVPTSSTNVLIPSAVPNYPVINSSITGMSNNLTIQAGATVTVNSGLLQVAGTVTNPASNIIATNGKVEFNGSAVQTIPANTFLSNTIKDLVITDAADVTLAGPLRVTNSVGFGNVNNSILFSNGNLTLASTASNTANVLDVTNGGVNAGNSISGDVVVERYVQGKRAYRFLTAPVNSTTSFKTNWMEGVSNSTPWANNDPNPGYGTHISGASAVANGFDATQTANPSMFTFNVSKQAWVSIPNTTGTFSAGTGYRVIVRGSRAVDLNDNNSASSPTTLRAKGALVTGPIKFSYPGATRTAGTPDISNISGAYSYIANTFASCVDWGSAHASAVDISPTYYIFDPTVSGSNGRGAYVAFNAVTLAKNVLSSLANQDLQSGQGFFVQTTGTNPKPEITFKETDKSVDFLPLFRTANTAPHISVELQLPSQVGTAASADGTAAYFSADYSNSICDDDSYKFTNQDENIAILRNGTPLSLEGRKLINGSDSLPLKLWQLTAKAYTLKVTVSNFADNVESYLEDKYLNVTTPLPNGETLVPFSITADAASAASNRFRIVFESFATLPVRITGIKAYEKNKGVQVDWIAESESDIDLYEVEKSADAQHFVTIGSTKARNNPSIAASYNAFDDAPYAGDNYYRIKTVEKSGDVKESEIVRVNIANGKSKITVVNNPVHDNVINLLFDNVQKGDYLVTMINIAGAKVYTGQITYSGGSVYKQVVLNGKPAPGIYQLQLVNGATVQNIQVLLQ